MFLLGGAEVNSPKSDLGDVRNCGVSDEQCNAGNLLVSLPKIEKKTSSSLCSVYGAAPVKAGYSYA